MLNHPHIASQLAAARQRAMLAQASQQRLCRQVVAGRVIEDEQDLPHQLKVRANGTSGEPRCGRG